MPNSKKWQVLAFCLLLISSLVSAQPAQNPQTFCNPLNLSYRFMVDAVDAREAADPVVVLFKDDYYLFASRSGGYWTSKDLRTWTLIVPTGLDLESYAPAVLAKRDTLFYTPSNSGRIYKTADPQAGVWVSGPAIKSYGDPALFFDDDGRLFMYYGLSNIDPIRVVELNPFTFQEIGTPVNLIFAQASIHGWERRGDDNLLDEQPWIEGSWMIKEKNKYYLHYAAPGTEFKTYADGIYVADAPLGLFQYAPYSPFSFKPTGFISGAGHGCTFKDKNGQYWHIITMTISVKHMFERRLGLFPVAFDADGNIHCNTAFSDYPQYFPGVKDKPITDNFAGMLLLSLRKNAMASSSLSDHGTTKAVDEDSRTYWCASSGDAGEWLMIDLGKECMVQAIQVNFAEHNTNPDHVRGRGNLLYEQYTIEKSADGMTWEMLVDKSQNLQDVPHDFIELAQPTAARFIKITNVFTPGGGNFAMRDLRIFGNSEQATFTPVDNITIERDADGRNAIIRWLPIANSDGYLVRYGIAPDKLYNNYMVYDEDSVAIHSLNKGVEYSFSVEAFDSGTESYRPTGEFRSFQSGNWDDVNTWAQYDGTTWIHPVPNVPIPTDGAIAILAGHDITVTTADSVDQLMIAAGGTLVINPGATLLVKDGIGTDMMVEGSVRNFGSLSGATAATLSFVNGGKYIHDQDGGSIPKAAWKTGSTCELNSIEGTVPANANQNFYNIVWNCPNHAGNLSTKWNGNTIGGNVVIQNTGTGRWQMCAPTTGTAATVTINGDIIQSGGQFTTNGTSNAGTTITINHAGNIDITGGNFSISRGSQGGIGTTVWNLLQGNVSFTNATTQNSNSDGAKFLFSKIGGTQTLTFSDVTFGGGGFPVEVDSGATVDIDTSILRGSGNFNLKAGATLETAHVAGLDSSLANTGTKTFDNAANFIFSGAAAQVTGSLLPDTVGSVTINNKAGVTLSKSVVVNGTMEMKSGALDLAGAILSYGTVGALQYSGATAQTTKDAEFPAVNGPKDLIVANSKGITLHAPRTISGDIFLVGKLKLETNTLTANSTVDATSSAYIVTSSGGVLRLNSMVPEQLLFPVGTTSYAPVWITNTGDPDTISVGAITDATAAEHGGRVKIKWNIGESVVGGGAYKIQFGWMVALEEAAFRTDRENNARIFNLADTSEAGSGDYTTQFATQPYTVARNGITTLGPFAIGRFRDVTGVAESAKNVPLKFSLSQNYPNPFNPATEIRYSLPAANLVQLKIYDVLGRQVVTLVNEKQPIGEHRIRFEARDVSSGVYIYQIKAGDFTQAQKMLLLK